MAELAQNKEWLDKIEKVSAAGQNSAVAADFMFLAVISSILVLEK